MCGIYLCSKPAPQKLSKPDKPDKPNKHVVCKPRGPDDLVIVETEKYYAAFYRLAIVDVLHGMQPFILGDTILLCNGEIYNHVYLAKQYNLQLETESDCECILHLYKMLGIERLLQLLDGEFAFVIHDVNVMHFARDKLGRKPLYYSMDASSLDVCSRLNGLEFNNTQQVKPRVIYTYDCQKHCLTQQVYHEFKFVPQQIAIRHNKLLSYLINAVHKRVSQSERPVGFLLSGGFDSSLILSIALQYSMMSAPPHVFTIGFAEDAPDVKSAEVMVDWLRQKHGADCIQWHRVIYTPQDGIAALPDVVKALETYDTTTIRASTPMYLISKYIADKTDVKVVLSGEGSDELFGGYLYFKYAPNDQAFRAEIIDRLNELYLYDVLRADRTTAIHGLEIRPPFLDDEFIEAVLQCVDLTKCVQNTKELIRKIVACVDLLPYDIQNGKKEAFSDAVGFTWKSAICQRASEWRAIAPMFSEYAPHIPPSTDEMAYFQHLFNAAFPNSWHMLPKLWLPNQDWVKTGVEPSARALPNYADAAWLITGKK